VRKSTIYLFVLGLAVVAMTALAGAGLVVSAQNSNSSTTMAPMAANTNTAAKRKPRRHKARRKPAADAATDAAAATDASTPAMAMTPKKTKTGRCDPTQQEQTDLSGTYTGKIKHGDEAAQDATLTITGNNFTLASGSDTRSGRVTATTTCGYTAATFMMGDLTPPPPSPNPPKALPAMSLRAKKVGDSLTLTSVPGEPQKVWFSTGGGAVKMKPRRHRAKAKAKTGTTPPPPAKMKM
jgi:sRNA-binding protein